MLYRKCNEINNRKENKEKSSAESGKRKKNQLNCYRNVKIMIRLQSFYGVIIPSVFLLRFVVLMSVWMWIFDEFSHCLFSFMISTNFRIYKVIANLWFGYFILQITSGDLTIYETKENRWTSTSKYHRNSIIVQLSPLTCFIIRNEINKSTEISITLCSLTKTISKLLHFDLIWNLSIY